MHSYGRYHTSFFWTLLWPTLSFCAGLLPLLMRIRGRWEVGWPRLADPPGPTSGHGVAVCLPYMSSQERVLSSGLFSLLGSGARWWASILWIESLSNPGEQVTIHEWLKQGSAGEALQGRLPWAGTLAGLHQRGPSSLSLRVCSPPAGSKLPTILQVNKYFSA